MGLSSPKAHENSLQIWTLSFIWRDSFIEGRIEALKNWTLELLKLSKHESSYQLRDYHVLKNWRLGR